MCLYRIFFFINGPGVHYYANEGVDRRLASCEVGHSRNVILRVKSNILKEKWI